ncbi:MAG: 50S ribosomal protein L2 [Candidatus Micrarchaeota archaeon]
MGKRLTQQRRGKGSPAYLSPGHRYVARAYYPHFVHATTTLGQVIDVLDDPARTTLLADILLQDGKRFYNLAAEGLAVGDKIDINSQSPAVPKGSIAPLASIPEGTRIFNVELRPGDGGKLSRTSGAAALLVAHDEETGLVSLQLSSKRVVTLRPTCLATIGVPSAGGRTEKPFKKAGAKRAAMAARNKYYPTVRGTAMNAYNHPHGGRSFGKPTTVSRHAPRGRKVGQISARSTGRRKSKSLGVQK